MRKAALILMPVLLCMYYCKKEDVIPDSGTITLDNTLQYSAAVQAYFGYGFLFSQAEKVSTLSKPAPDITVDGDGTNLFLMTDNFKDSFFKSGEYPDEASAKEAFDKLKTVEVNQWLAMATPLKPHQVWIYRTGKECYAKIRIISTISEVRDNRDFAECTFEWVYQPDGSLTFPGK
jgi:hypothetical protein